MRDHKKLIAFILADELVIEIYRMSRNFHREELYGLTSQIRRAAVSIATNIVDGSARSTQNEYHRFLDIAYSSLQEAYYQFELAIKLDFISKEEFDYLDLKFIRLMKVLGSLKLKMRAEG